MPTNNGKAKRQPARRAVVPPATPPAHHTKTAVILALLKRPDGATIDELMRATGWQAHSVRGFVSGTLRKHLSLTIIKDAGAYRLTDPHDEHRPTKRKN